MVKRNLPPVQDELVSLRLLTRADLVVTLNWRNQAHIRRWFFHSDQITWEQHLGWFEKYLERDDDFVFIIEDLATGQPVGQVALYHIDWQTQRAEYGRLMIGEEIARGKGYAKAATRLVCLVGFENLGLEEIYLEVYEDNQAARAVYADCSFQLNQVKDGVAYMSLRREELSG